MSEFASTGPTVPLGMIRELEIRCEICGADAGVVAVMEDGSLTNVLGGVIDRPLCGDCSFTRRYADARQRVLQTNYAELSAEPEMATLLSDMAFLICAIERQLRDERDARKALEADQAIHQTYRQSRP